MKRLQTNIMIDVAMFFTMALLSISGWVLKVAIPSKGGMHHRGVNSFYDVLGWERCTWREIHVWAGIVMLVLLCLHIVFHWKMISAYFEKNMLHSSTRYVFYAILLILAIISIVPWIFVIIS